MRIIPQASPNNGLEARDIVSFCGFWLDADPTVTWTYWCPSNTQCAIDTHQTPHIVFCPAPAFVPYTTYYAYDDWPSGGCGSHEYCCPSGQRVIIKEYNDGATTDAACLPTERTDLPLTLSCHTQLGAVSVSLSTYDESDLDTTSNTFPITSFSSRESKSSSSNPIALQTTISGPVETHSSPAPSSSGLTQDGKVGLIVGLIGSVVAIAGVIVTWKTYKYMKKDEGKQSGTVSETVLPNDDASAVVHHEPAQTA